MNRYQTSTDTSVEDGFEFQFGCNVGPRFRTRLRALLITKFNFKPHCTEVYADKVEVDTRRILTNSQRYSISCYIQGVLDGASNWKS